jgi:hypothetical protein
VTRGTYWPDTGLTLAVSSSRIPAKVASRAGSSDRIAIVKSVHSKRDLPRLRPGLFWLSVWRARGVTPKAGVRWAAAALPLFDDQGKPIFGVSDRGGRRPSIEAALYHPQRRRPTQPRDQCDGTRKRSCAVNMDAPALELIANAPSVGIVNTTNSHVCDLVHRQRPSTIERIGRTTVPQRRWAPCGDRDLSVLRCDHCGSRRGPLRFAEQRHRSDDRERSSDQHQSCTVLHADQTRIRRIPFPELA